MVCRWIQLRLNSLQAPPGTFFLLSTSTNSTPTGTLSKGRESWLLITAPQFNLLVAHTYLYCFLDNFSLCIQCTCVPLGGRLLEGLSSPIGKIVGWPSLTSQLFYWQNSMVTHDFPIDIVRVLFPTFLVHSFTSSLRQVIFSPPLIIIFFLFGGERNIHQCSGFLDLFSVDTPVSALGIIWGVRAQTQVSVLLAVLFLWILTIDFLHVSFLLELLFVPMPFMVVSPKRLPIAFCYYSKGYGILLDFFEGLEEKHKTVYGQWLFPEVLRVFAFWESNWHQLYTSDLTSIPSLQPLSNFSFIVAMLLITAHGLLFPNTIFAT